MHRYVWAADYLTVGQIYRKDNPPLREPFAATVMKEQAASLRAPPVSVAELLATLDGIGLNRSVARLNLTSPSPVNLL